MAAIDGYLRPGANVTYPGLARTDGLLVTFAPDVGGPVDVISRSGTVATVAVLAGSGSLIGGAVVVPAQSIGRGSRAPGVYAVGRGTLN